MLYRTRQILVDAVQLDEPLDIDGAKEGTAGDWLVHKVGGQEWFLCPQEEFLAHYEPMPEDESTPEAILAQTTLVEGACPPSQKLN